ncbi:MAG: hypothetical protein ACOYNB_06995 [Aquabacterium sp.]|uniref:hypothetical protein n=1 Tax=Aquabacterium sp. TaxID=1872578 RepID=UPI003BD869DE
MFVAFSQPAAAQEATYTSESGSTESTTDTVLTTTQQHVRSSVEWLASGVDSWFGEKPFSEGGKVSNGELGWTVYKREDQPSTTGIRFKARFKLPNLESHSYLFIGNDDRREIVTDQPDTFSRQQQLLRNDNRDNTFFAGIGTTIRESVDLRLGFRGGLKPYGQARYRHPWQLSPDDRVEFRETVFYSVADRIGSTTAISYDHALSNTLNFRWLNAITVTQSSKDAAWSSSVGTYKSFGEQRVLSLEALMGGVIGNDVTVADYGLQTKWSQPVHKDFVIGEVVVGHFWPRSSPLEPRRQAWAIGTGVKLKF